MATAAKVCRTVSGQVWTQAFGAGTIRPMKIDIITSHSVDEGNASFGQDSRALGNCQKNVMHLSLSLAGLRDRY
jgi:hypothetical protein